MRKAKKVEAEEQSPAEEEKGAVATIDVDFGRADLNALRDKVNELALRSK